ncbi:hypothetical protein AAL_05477 [Moelleriella libera RCEF 2490]|uniref:Uncharacterized protein n=1 Tax=Moelleriella libera RCEF 2490 TaxID=1081109 RepID=A0A168ACL7_9HYPO|nr:hypothetical protein AAL_05477 [Moelleriella libera RCEF 2490]
MAGAQQYKDVEILFILKSVLLNLSFRWIIFMFHLRFGRLLTENQVKYIKGKYGRDPRFGTPMANTSGFNTNSQTSNEWPVDDSILAIDFEMFEEQGRDTSLRVTAPPLATILRARASPLSPSKNRRQQEQEVEQQDRDEQRDGEEQQDQYWQRHYQAEPYSRQAHQHHLHSGQHHQTDQHRMAERYQRHQLPQHPERQQQQQQLQQQSQEHRRQLQLQQGQMPQTQQQVEQRQRQLQLQRQQQSQHRHPSLQLHEHYQPQQYQHQQPRQPQQPMEPTLVAPHPPQQLPPWNRPQRQLQFPMIETTDRRLHEPLMAPHLHPLQQQQQQPAQHRTEPTARLLFQQQQPQQDVAESSAGRPVGVPDAMAHLYQQQQAQERFVRALDRQLAESAVTSLRDRRQQFLHNVDLIESQPREQHHERPVASIGRLSVSPPMDQHRQPGATESGAAARPWHYRQQDSIKRRASSPLASRHPPQHHHTDDDDESSEDASVKAPLSPTSDPPQQAIKYEEESGGSVAHLSPWLLEQAPRVIKTEGTEAEAGGHSTEQAQQHDDDKSTESAADEDGDDVDECADSYDDDVDDDECDESDFEEQEEERPPKRLRIHATSLSAAANAYDDGILRWHDDPRRFVPVRGDAGIKVEVEEDVSTCPTTDFVIDPELRSRGESSGITTQESEQYHHHYHYHHQRSRVRGQERHPHPHPQPLLQHALDELDPTEHQMQFLEALWHRSRDAAAATTNTTKAAAAAAACAVAGDDEGVAPVAMPRNTTTTTTATAAADSPLPYGDLAQDLLGSGEQFGGVDYCDGARWPEYPYPYPSF